MHIQGKTKLPKVLDKHLLMVNFEYGTKLFDSKISNLIPKTIPHDSHW